jgi:hypothetical protein
MPVQGTVEGSLMVYHLHYPSGNPHDDQAVHVDIGADAGGDLT